MTEYIKLYFLLKYIEFIYNLILNNISDNLTTNKRFITINNLLKMNAFGNELEDESKVEAIMQR